MSRCALIVGLDPSSAREPAGCAGPRPDNMRSIIRSRSHSEARRSARRERVPEPALEGSADERRRRALCEQPPASVGCAQIVDSVPTGELMSSRNKVAAPCRPHRPLSGSELPVMVIERVEDVRIAGSWLPRCEQLHSPATRLRLQLALSLGLREIVGGEVGASPAAGEINSAAPLQTGPICLRPQTNAACLA